MKKQEVLDYLKLKELPEAAQKSNKKCAALVLRTTGVQDYVICKNSGVVVDKKFRAGIAKIIEFYPETTKEKFTETPPPPVEIEVATPKPPVPPIPVKKNPAPAKFDRHGTIKFLTKNGHKSAIKKTNVQLKEILAAYGK